MYEKNDLAAELHADNTDGGYIEVTTPSAMTPKSVHEFIVLVNNGYDRTLMQTLTFVKGTGRVTDQTSTILNTNFDTYSIEIPNDAQYWLSVTPTLERLLEMIPFYLVLKKILMKVIDLHC